MILKKKTDKPYTYVSFYIENYNNEEINYIPEKIGEIPDVTIEKKEVDLKENNLKTEIIGGNAVNLEDVKNYFKKFKPNYDESCAKLEISNEKNLPIRYIHFSAKYVVNHETYGLIYTMNPNVSKFIKYIHLTKIYSNNNDVCKYFL